MSATGAGVMSATGAKGAEVRRRPADRRRRMAAAGLAAAAEAGLVFLPVMQLLSESVRASGGPLASYAMFLPLFVFGVVMWAGLPPLGRHTWIAAGVAVATGLAEGLVWGDGNALGTAFAVVLALLVVLRMVTLAARDWRDPVKGSFFWGSVAALVEIGVARSANPAWRSLLPLVVAQFFAGSMGSRAASVMIVDRHSTAAPSEGRSRALLPFLGLGSLVAALAVSVLLGGPHGLLQVTGGFVFRSFDWVLTALAYVFARVLLEPLTWVLRELHFSLGPLQHLIRVLTHPGPPSNRPAHHLLALLWLERVVGLALLVAVSWAIVKLIRIRWRRRTAAARPVVPSPEPLPSGAEADPRFRVRRPRLHRELPADTVRRWYAEALLVLERRGLSKPRGLTPREYLGDVARAFPECQAAFEALTRTYEDVRYGSLAVEPATLQGIDGRRRSMMEAFRRMERADRPVEESSGKEAIE